MSAAEISLDIESRNSNVQRLRDHAVISLAGGLATKLFCRSCSDDVELARHESAHCVAAISRGYRFSGVSIIPAIGHSRGRLSYHKVSIGQLEAEAKTAPPRTDLESAGLYLSQMRELGSEVTAAQLFAETEALLDQHWPVIRHLADCLILRRTLDFRQCLRIVYGAQRKQARRFAALREQDRRLRFQNTV
jgi:hypothetical protein